MVTRIGILGAGAIGCVVGGLLTKAGHDVTLMDQWPEHVEALKRDGLRLSGTCGEHVIPVTALHLHEMQRITRPFDAVFVAVKSYDTEWATALGLAYLARPDGVVVGFQNGELDGRDTPRARELAALLSAVAPTTVTTNLFGERWSKLAINCMANPIAGVSGLGSAEVRTEPEPRRIAIHLA